MRNKTIRSNARTWRTVATSAALATTFAALGTLGTAGTASAVSYWTAVTQDTASFTCVSNCQAGGVGAVENGGQVRAAGNIVPGAAGYVGQWERTVHIYCKNPQQKSYNVTVQDKNWSGTWNVARGALKRSNFDDSGFPVC